MDNNILQGIITVLAVILTYIFTRKKNAAEVRKMDASATVDEISATEKAVAIWRGLAEELRAEVEDLRQLIEELRQEIDELKAQNESLREEMRIYKNN